VYLPFGLLSLSCVVLLIRSFWLSDTLMIRRDNDCFIASAITGLGGIQLSYSRSSGDPDYRFRDATVLRTWFPPQYPYESRPWPKDSGMGELVRLAGIQVAHHVSVYTPRIAGISSTSHVIIVVPLLLPAILFALPHLLVLRGHRELLRRRRLGLCLHCGYDLRTQPTICPECGAAVSR
jgi:hypothetical protein